jgi:meckelin
LIDIFSTLFFWFLFALTGYWFIFFKLQERVYCFLPGLDTHDTNFIQFDILFATVAATKFILVLFKIIFEQSTLNYFLIDWERPKAEDVKDADLNSKREVNAWRSLFLLNELNELQTYKLIQTDFTLIVYGIVMEGFGIKYWTSYAPDLVTVATNSPNNYTLFFFVTACLVYIIASIQYAFKYLVKGKFPLKTEELIDLCSITNISILIFDESFHGYYVHGRSPYGQAEISSGKLKKALNYEQSGKGQIRGMSEENPELQTFEIYLPPDVIMRYRANYLLLVDTEIGKTHTKNENTLTAVSKIL